MAHNRPLLTARDLDLQTDDEEPLDVLDLPQLYTRPSAKTLLATLDDLTSLPPSWQATPRSGTPRSSGGANTPLRRKRKVKSEGLPHYLTKIISSPLAWIEHDTAKEQIWEAASQRLSERSGRTARGAISRVFTIPLVAVEVEDSETAVTETGDAEEVLDIMLHEPTLTADNLGFKTWASSYLLARRMVRLRDTLPPLALDTQVLELGAGTGLVGLAAAAVLKRAVVLTDLPEIVPNLERNVRANAAILATHGGRAKTAIVDWSEPAPFSLGGERQPPHAFPLILVADPLYSSEHPALLVRAIDQHLGRSRDARVVVEIPIREGYTAERQDFRDRIEGLGLVLVEEGKEVGYDDWSDGTDEEGLAEVTCWWSIWAWR